MYSVPYRYIRHFIVKFAFFYFTYFTDLQIETRISTSYKNKDEPITRIY